MPLTIDHTASYSFNCPECNQSLSTEKSQIGAIVTCPSCQQTFKIPGAILKHRNRIEELRDLCRYMPTIAGIVLLASYLAIISIPPTDRIRLLFPIFPLNPIAIVSLLLFLRNYSSPRTIERRICKTAFVISLVAIATRDWVVLHRIDNALGPKISSVQMEDGLTASFYGITERRIICSIEPTSGSKPETIDLDYFATDTNTLIKSETIALTTNPNGVKLLEHDIPNFEKLVNLHIRRPSESR
jgi:hypothetical protein